MMGTGQGAGLPARARPSRYTKGVYIRMAITRREFIARAAQAGGYSAAFMAMYSLSFSASWKPNKQKASLCLRPPAEGPRC